MARPRKEILPHLDRKYSRLSVLFKLPGDLLDRLDALCKEVKMPRSEVLRIMIAKGLDEARTSKDFPE